jgi:hypothetical protein
MKKHCSVVMDENVKEYLRAFDILLEFLVCITKIEATGEGKFYYENSSLFSMRIDCDHKSIFHIDALLKKENDDQYKIVSVRMDYDKKIEKLAETFCEKRCGDKDKRDRSNSYGQAIKSMDKLSSVNFEFLQH